MELLVTLERPVNVIAAAQRPWHAAQPPSHVNILCLIATAVSGRSQSGQLQKVRLIQGSSHHYDSPPGKDYVDTGEKNSSKSVNSP